MKNKEQIQKLIEEKEKIAQEALEIFGERIEQFYGK